MKRVSLFVLFVLLSVSCFSFEYYSSSEIFKIINDSKVNYSIDILDSLIFVKNYSNYVLTPSFYRVEDKNKLSLVDYEMNEELKMILNQAENCFKQKDYENAITNYKKGLKINSKLYFLYTYIGQCYSNMGDFKKAEKYYKTAIKKDYTGYMAHWFLADLYYVSQKIDKALDEITLAWIFNRNHEMIKESVYLIYKADNRRFDDWYFTPQITITKEGEDSISVKSDSLWLSYALTKAAYSYDPALRDSSSSDNNTQINFEIEGVSLINQYLFIDEKRDSLKENYPLKTLIKSIDSKNLDNYILFEIISPVSPHFNYLMDRASVKNLKNYLLNCRHTKNKI